MRIVATAPLVAALLVTTLGAPARLMAQLDPRPRSWQEAYDRGVRAVEHRNWTQAISFLQQAKRDGPTPGRHVRFSADRSGPFLPDYYLGVAYAEMGRDQEARDAFEQVEHGRWIQRDDPERTRMRRYQDRVRKSSEARSTPSAPAPSSTVRSAAPSPTPSIPAPAQAVPAPGTHVAVGSPVSAAPAGPLPTANESLESELRRAWDALDQGRIAYEPSRQMTEGTPEEVLVRVARDDGVDLIAPFPTRPQVEALKTSGTMMATLTGPLEDFIIQPLSNEVQAIVGPFVDWRWRVMPLRSADMELNLRVSARIFLSNGTAQARDLLVKSARITVQSNYGWRLSRFWSRSWQWVLGSPVLIGALGWLATLFRRQLRGARRPVGF